MRRFEWILLLALAVSTGLLAMAPWWIMNPARAQTQSEIELAFALRGGWNTVFSFTAFGAGALLCLRRWLVGRALEKLAAVVSLFLIGLCAAVANINMIGEVFQPIFAKEYTPAAEAGFLSSEDLLLVYGESDPPRAYPLRLLGYHHLVEDEAAGTRLLATYDAFSRSAIIWKPELDGQPLQFTLAGIYNQNFLMRDEQTGSWWVQATGEAVAGTLRGRKLEPLPSETLTLAILAREHPQAEVLEPADGSVLLPGDPLAPRQGLPAPPAEGPLDALTLVVGISTGGEAIAFPADSVPENTPLRAETGGKAIAIMREGGAFRAFLAPPEAEVGFHGAGLERLPVRVEYWFAWKRAYPRTTVDRQ
jgi:hypothetical protein